MGAAKSSRKERPPDGGRWLVVAGLVAALLGCVAAVRGAYGPYDTSQCYWTWVDDGYGGYEQLHCWNPNLSGYYQYSYGGNYVRRYPSWYSGHRVVVAPPRVGIVRPRGVVVVPPPMARPGGMHGGPMPQAVPSPR